MLPDDEFRAFQELLIQDPTAVTLSQAQAVLEKFAGTVLEWETGWHSDNLLQRNTQWPNLSALIYPKNEQDDLTEEQRKA